MKGRRFPNVLVGGWTEEEEGRRAAEAQRAAKADEEARAQSGESRRTEVPGRRRRVRGQRLLLLRSRGEPFGEGTLVRKQLLTVALGGEANPPAFGSTLFDLGFRLTVVSPAGFDGLWKVEIQGVVPPDHSQRKDAITR